MRNNGEAVHINKVENGVFEDVFKALYCILSYQPKILKMCDFKRKRRKSYECEVKC